MSISKNRKNYFREYVSQNLDNDKGTFFTKNILNQLCEV